MFIESSGREASQSAMHRSVTIAAIAWNLAAAPATAAPQLPSLTLLERRGYFDLHRGGGIDDIVAAVRREYPGEVLDARLLDRGGLKNAVRVDLITRYGVRLVIVVASQTGALLEFNRGDATFIRRAEGCQTATVPVPEFVTRAGVPPGAEAHLNPAPLIQAIARQIPGTFLDAGHPPPPDQAGPLQVKWLTSDGRRLFLAVDARTGRVLKKLDEVPSTRQFEECGVRFSRTPAPTILAR